MNKDFTLSKYRSLLIAFQQAGYRFIPFEDYCRIVQDPTGDLHTIEPFVMLRHDVDLRAANSLHTAKMEHELGIRASYYFRVIPQSNQPGIIRAIALLGHEIGYHYEDMSIADGNVDKALEHFGKWLTYFRGFYPVATICMHGAPTSRYDGRDLWKTKSYRDFGIIGEPYFDVDFDRVFYLTDTGREWDGFRVSVRDKVKQQEEWTRQGRTFHTTDHIISCLKDGTYRKKIGNAVMVTTHPQRWTDQPLQWTQEYVAQSAKNIVKRLLLWAKGY